MFDSEDLEFIADVPALSGLTPSQISRLITRAAISIESLVADGTPNESNSVLLEELQRLARSMEALVVVRPERDNVRSAAFVAALAHSALRISHGDRWLSPAVSADSVSPGLVTPLLYAIGGSPGDAHALAKELVKSASLDIADLLARALGNLVLGNLLQIINIVVPPLPDDIDIQDAAASQLFVDLLKLTIQIAKRYSVSTQRLYWSWDLDQIKGEISRIRDVSHYRFDVRATDYPEFIIHAVNDFAGPAHLATLLGILVDSLEQSSALILLGDDIPNSDISPAITAVMLKRPFLWPNHIRALESGVLDSQVSAVVTYPTGAGKSTIMELRVSLTLDQGKSVIVLAPTNSLVEQTKKSLYSLFPDALIRNDAVPMQDRPCVFVLTPEKYLILREALHSNISVNLLIFDEFHLIHSTSGGHGRRSLDAMLSVLLYLRDLSQGSIILMSAMVRNGAELCEWIAAATERPCLNLNDEWRPNRQIRGMIAYDAASISAIRVGLGEIRNRNASASAPKEAMNITQAIPYALFSIQRAWSGDPQDIIVSRVLDETVSLGLGRQTDRNRVWHLTANANVLAAAIAEKATQSGARVMVFSQTVPWAHSIAVRLQKINPVSYINPTDIESRWIQDIVLEFGSSAPLYLSFGASGQINSAAISHHGLLLSQERLLHESLYTRSGGVRVLVATSTLAQGMNLPADVVLIAGDSRYDLGSAEYSRIEAHELLNAAGRAGRAGSSNKGSVLLIPSIPLQFAGTVIPELTGRLFSRVFGEDDASLTIEDPIESLLSSVDNEESVEQLRYVAGRVTGEYQSTIFAAEETLTEVVSVIRKSFSAHSRDQPSLDGDLLRVAERLQSLEQEVIQENLLISQEVLDIAAASGISSGSLETLMNSLGSRDNSMSVIETLADIRDSLGDIPYPRRLLPPWLHSGEAQEPVELIPGETEYTSPVAFIDYEWSALFAWVGGETMEVIEAILCEGSGKAKNRQYSHARRFVLHRISDFVFVVSLPARVWRLRTDQESDEVLNRLELCVREGFDSPVKLAIWEAEGRERMRIWCHRRFEEYDPWMDIE